MNTRKGVKNAKYRIQRAKLLTKRYFLVCSVRSGVWSCGSLRSDCITDEALRCHSERSEESSVEPIKLGMIKKEATEVTSFILLIMIYTASTGFVRSEHFPKLTNNLIDNSHESAFVTHTITSHCR